MVPIPYHIAEIKEWRKNGSHVSEAVRGIVKRLAKLTGNNDYLKIHGLRLDIISVRRLMREPMI